MAEVTLKNQFAADESPVSSEVIKAGVVSGLIGGVLMAAYAMAAGVVLKQGAFAIPKLIGATFRGPEALLSGPGTIAWGIVLHLIVSAAFGVLFATLVRRDTPRPASMLAGIAFALGLFVMMMFVVVPVTNPVMANRVSMMIGTTLVMHLLYGIGLGLAPTLRRVFVQKAPPVVRTPTRITISAR